jgi:4-hydroxybenzoate polyprenyltransferase
MWNKIIKFIFFGNYFVGILGIVLSLETVIQLRLPFNSIAYYTLLFSGTVMYYTYAYSTPLLSFKPDNPRSAWYNQHYGFVKFSQWFLLFVCILIGSLLLIKDYTNLLHLPIGYWLVGIIMSLSATLYYGLLPRSFFKLNLRNKGWIKAFVIGFVWACSVTLLPVIVLQLEHGYCYVNTILLIGLFIKNFMFCTVNAIIFDLKDYADDSNQQLKTFVVRFGLHKTIFFILLPLTLIGMFFLFPVAYYRHFTFLPFFFNLVPFLLLLWLIYSVRRQKSLLYYLIVIDGLIFIKAICGIIAMQFVH